MTKTEETTEIEYQEVTLKIPKPFYDAMLRWLNKHPYYEDFEEFALEALREYNLERIMQQAITDGKIN
jgi:hypothetical protein